MAKRRSRKRPEELVPAVETGAPPSPIYRQPVFLASAFGIALIVYLLLFFTAPYPSFGKKDGQYLFNRIEHLQMLIAEISTVVGSWFGGDFSNVALWDRIGVLLAVAAILAAAYVVGLLLLELLGGDRGLTRLENFVFAEGIGLNVLSLYTLAVGLLGGLRFLLAFTLPMAAVLMIAGIRWKRRWLLPDKEKSFQEVQQPDSVGKRHWLASYSMWLLIPFALLILLGGMLPPVHFDVREYHLQAPKEWYQQGQVTFMPHNVYANMPLGAEMHALLGMVIMQGQHDWWWGAMVGKTVMALFAPLTALALFALGKRFFSATAGGVAAAVYLSSPWIARVSILGLNEGAAAFYLLLVVYAALLWWHGNPQNDKDHAAGIERSRLLLAGFLAGAAVACKYPAVVFVALPLVIAIPACYFLAGKLKKTLRLPLWQAVGIVLLAIAVGCGLWLAKNAALAGNPTYPLLYNVFGGKTRTDENNAQWKQAHKVPPYSTTELVNAVQRVAWKSEWLSLLLLPLAGLSLLAVDKRQMIWLLAGLLFFQLAAWWLLTHRNDRFWLPAVPIWAMLAGVGATTIDRRWWRAQMAVLLACVLAINFLIIASPGVCGNNRYFVSLEALRRDEPSHGEAFTRVTAAHRYLNKNVTAGNRALLVGDAQPFDLNVPVLYNTCFDECIFERWMKGRDKQQRLNVLRENNISHVYISWSDIDRYRSPGNYGFTGYVTRRLIHEDLVDRQQLLRRVDIGLSPQMGEIFEVVYPSSDKR